MPHLFCGGSSLPLQNPPVCEESPAVQGVRGDWLACSLARWADTAARGSKRTGGPRTVGLSDSFHLRGRGLATR